MFRGASFWSESVSGEDFEVQNPNLMSKIAKSVARRPKITKNRSGMIMLVSRVVALGLVQNSLSTAFGCPVVRFEPQAEET